MSRELNRGEDFQAELGGGTAHAKALDMWLKSGLSKLDSECPEPSTKGENGREETREDVTAI